MFIDAELYRRIVAMMPIACVDLVVTGDDGRVLLLKRNNPPARDQWWFPGGRVHHGESRVGAAVRKLNEECGLSPLRSREIGTYDLMLGLDGAETISHGITTVYQLFVVTGDVRLDAQSANSCWLPVGEWLDILDGGFVRTVLQTVFGEGA